MLPFNTGLVGLGSVALLLSLCGLPAAQAQPSAGGNAAPSTAAPPPAAAAPVQIWYRSSAGCPDGAAFLALLARLGRPASLADVGDRVDFVVTVAYAPERSGGRLERQSSQGTVAIRDVVASTCAEVTDALALSLDLSFQPGAAAEAAAPSSAPTSLGSMPAEDAARPSLWQTRLGVQGQVSSGLAGAVLPGAALFVDLGRVPPAFGARLSLWGARGVEDAAVDLSLGLLGSRFESCWGFGLGAWTVSPCLGLELGILVAEGEGAGGRSDTGLWSSAVAHLRAGWQLNDALSLEAQLGPVLPFVRYRFDALTGSEVAASSVLGLQAGLGVAFLL